MLAADFASLYRSMGRGSCVLEMNSAVGAVSVCHKFKEKPWHMYRQQMQFTR